MVVWRECGCSLKLYDHTGQRISKNFDLYPFSFYELEGSGKTVRRVSEYTIEKVTCEGDGEDACSGTGGGEPGSGGDGDAFKVSKYATLKDHLSGASVMLDEDGIVAQLLDYYPYGETRLEKSWSNFDEKKKYTGHELDDETGLYYANARYYNPATARFLSLDPAALNNPGRFLTDPQQLNFYAYARNNPLKYVDPSGTVIWFAPAAGGAVGSAVVAGLAESAAAIATVVGLATTSIAIHNQPSEPLTTPAYDGERLSKPHITLPPVSEWSNTTTIPAEAPKPPSILTTPSYTKDPKDLIHTQQWQSGEKVGDLSTNPGQQKSLDRFNRKKPRAAGQTKIFDLPNGGKTLQTDVPAKNIPGSKAVYEKQIDNLGNTLEYTKTTYDGHGKIIHVKDKIKNTSHNNK